jgi:hypothetical protein
MSHASRSPRLKTLSAVMCGLFGASAGACSDAKTGDGGSSGATTDVLAADSAGEDAAPLDAATTDSATTDSAGADTSAPPAAPSKVDFVLLVDSTPSMCGEQAALAKAASAFVARLDGIEGLDYRISVVSQNAVAAGVVGVFQAAPATTSPFACVEQKIQPCLRPGTSTESLPATFTDACVGADCGCSHLGAEWSCDAPSTAKQAVNCNGSINTSCRRTCTTDAECDTALVDAAAGASCAADPATCVFQCLSPAGSVEQSGCVRRPPTATCPEATVLRSTLLADAGSVCGNGEPCGAALPCADGGACTPVTAPWVSRTNAAKSLACLAVPQVVQEVSASLEQGLNALYYAVSRAADAPNAAQARQFVRDDALLVFMVVSDEDDCSATDCQKDASGAFACGASVLKENYGACTCLTDTTAGGPLRPVSEAVAMLRSLKADPAQILFAVVDGDAPSGNDQEAAREAYRASKCRECVDVSAEHPQLFNTSICTSAFGRADDGRRYREVVEAFGDNGIYTSICGSDPFAATFTALGDRIVKMLAAEK